MVAINDKKNWWNETCHKNAEEALRNANELIHNAQQSIKQNNIELSEKFFRDSLSKIREAVLWQPDNKIYSMYLHNIGQKIHDTFGCRLDFNEGAYWVTCPVLLSHSKGGFSVGGSGKAICSICGQDIFDCEHVKGEFYNEVIGIKFDGICNICGGHICEHIEGQIYNEVHAFAIVTTIDLDHVAFVTNPSNPLCVVHKYTLSIPDLLEALPKDERDEFIYGKTVVNCHHCLICKGDGE